MAAEIAGSQTLKAVLEGWILPGFCLYSAMFYQHQAITGLPEDKRW
jgi:hypothetical protein